MIIFTVKELIFGKMGQNMKVIFLKVKFMGEEHIHGTMENNM